MKTKITTYIIATAFVVTIQNATSNTKQIKIDNHEIYMKTLNEGFSYEYEYILKKGKIYIKPNTKNTGKEGDWKLFNGTGIPNGKGAEGFSGNNIKGFGTEGTMIVAEDSVGRLFFWQPTLKENTKWENKTGAPFASSLYLPKNKTWSFSMSVKKAPWKRLTPMNDKDIVSYWEDCDGNKTDFGFTATIYSLDTDGQLIRYTDTGLPTSWNRAFTSPMRGKLIIENMSTSASTIFITDKYGNMYTKMMDYEIQGGCPALRFVYEHDKRTKGNEIAPIMKAVRTLPLPDWRNQEKISQIINDSTHTAAATTNITITLTGKGNAARELRVEGKNEKGIYGYWKKEIFGNKWSFVETGQKYNKEKEIINYCKKIDTAKSKDRDYKGKIRLRRWKHTDAELIGFYYYDTPCTLKVRTPKGKYVYMTLHTVDMWSPVAQMKKYPELVGNASGEPKLLQGTIEIADSTLLKADNETQKFIKKYFSALNRAPFALSIWADDQKVKITTRKIQRDINKNMHYRIRHCISMNMINIIKNGEQRTDTFYIHIANDKRLTEGTITDSLIVRNKQALIEIKNIMEKIRKEHIRNKSICSIAKFAYNIFNGTISVVRLPHWADKIEANPYIEEEMAEFGGVSYTGGNALKQYSDMNMEMARKTPRDYKEAKKILENRIKLLKENRY